MARKSAAASQMEDVLSGLQEDLNRHFGAGSANLLSANDTLSKIDHWVSSRSIVVDSVLRGCRPVGSSLFPFGRQVEISGVAGAGKTTMCAHVAAEVQYLGGLVVVTDTEERIDEVYWQKLGVDLTKVLHISAPDLVDVFNKQYRALQFAKERAPEIPLLMIWDSLGGTAGAEMIDPDDKENPMEQAAKFGMRRAKIISDGMELVNTVVSKTRTCFMYTNHEYQNIGVTYGNTRETRGGNKPKYFATVRLQFTPVGKIKENDPISGNEMVIGQRVRVRALKNSMAGVLLERDAVVMANRGFCNEYTVFEVGQKLGYIDRKGSWSTWISPQGEEIKFQGFNGFEEKVVAHSGYADLLNAVMESM